MGAGHPPIRYVPSIPTGFSTELLNERPYSLGYDFNIISVLLYIFRQENLKNR